MPRYLIERALPEGVGAFLVEHPVSAIVLANTDLGVAWLYSYVSSGADRLFCLYEAANPEAIRKAARRTGLPIEVIHRVTVLEPHAYVDGAAGSDAASSPGTAERLSGPPVPPDPPTAVAAAGSRTRRAQP